MLQPWELKDPFALIRALWPDVYLYREQRLILASAFLNDETYAVAGNMLGKDFIAGLVALTFFLTRTPCRVVTTSADYAQLQAVLWGEMRKFIQTAAVPLTSDRGGPLLVNHLHIRKFQEPGVLCPLSYLVGRVALKGEGLLGHHVADVGDGEPKTMLLGDEASGLDNMVYERGSTWARRMLFIGNPYPTRNFFYQAVKGGDVPKARAA